MTITESYIGDIGELKISGVFAFSDCSEFRLKLVDCIAKKVKTLRIDISNLASIDSAGLGMFLVAASDCKENNIDLSICTPQGNVKVLLDLTKGDEGEERFRVVD